MIALRAARVFDGECFVDDPVVVIDGDAIASVGAPAPPDADVVDLADATLTPGLIDTHSHLVFNGAGTLEEQVAGVSDDELRERARNNARIALVAGITTIRDLGDRGYVTLDLRDDPTLPTILAAGPPLTLPGGHCWFLGGECRGTDELVAAVHEHKARGCDVVKIMMTGGALTPTTPMWKSQFSLDELRAVVAAAHAAGLPVAAHCHGSGGIVDAVAARVDTIEHCSFFTADNRSEPDDAILKDIVAAGIAVSATLGKLPGAHPPPVIAQNIDTMIAALGRFHDMGGTIVVGTDGGIAAGKPHDILPYALFDLVGPAYMRGDEALSAITAVAAQVLGLGDRKGRLAPGYDADVVAFGGDPTESLLDVRGVWRAGVRV